LYLFSLLKEKPQITQIPQKTQKGKIFCCALRVHEVNFSNKLYVFCVVSVLSVFFYSNLRGSVPIGGSFLHNMRLLNRQSPEGTLYAPSGLVGFNGHYLFLHGEFGQLRFTFFALFLGVAEGDFAFFVNRYKHRVAFFELSGE